MAWTLLEKATFTAATDYRARIGQAFLKLANDVVNESGSTTNHANRLTLAEQVISGSGVPSRCYELLPVLNPALQVDGGEPTDNDIIFTVSQQWDFFANEL